jgi:hypothetical protein
MRKAVLWNRKYFFWIRGSILLNNHSGSKVPIRLGPDPEFRILPGFFVVIEKISCHKCNTSLNIIKYWTFSWTFFKSWKIVRIRIRNSESALWNRNYFLRFRFRLLKSYGSGSGSGSYLWKVTVMVPVLVPTFEKFLFWFRFWFLPLRSSGSGSGSGSGSSAISRP